VSNFRIHVPRSVRSNINDAGAAIRGGASRLKDKFSDARAKVRAAFSRPAADPQTAIQFTGTNKVHDGLYVENGWYPNPKNGPPQPSARKLLTRIATPRQPLRQAALHQSKQPIPEEASSESSGVESEGGTPSCLARSEEASIASNSHADPFSRAYNKACALMRSTNKQADLSALHEKLRSEGLFASVTAEDLRVLDGYAKDGAVESYAMALEGSNPSSS